MLNPLRTASRKACGWCDAKPTIRRLWQWVIFCRFAHLDFGRTFFSFGHDQPIPCGPSTRVCRLPQLGCSVDRAANSPIAGDVACWPIASTHRSMVVGLPRKPTRLRNCAPSIASSDRCPVSEVLRSLPSSSLDAGFIMAARSGSLVRPEGASHLWRRVPPSELSIELVADGRRGRVTGSVEAS